MLSSDETSGHTTYFYSILSTNSRLNCGTRPCSYICLLTLQSPGFRTASASKLGVQPHPSL